MVFNKKNSAYFILTVLIICLISVNIFITTKLFKLKELEEDLSVSSNIISNYEIKITGFENLIKDYENKIYILEENEMVLKDKIDELSNEINQLKYEMSEKRNRCNVNKFRDVRDVFKYLDYTKNEIFGELGETQHQQVTYDTTDVIGYIYNELGITFMFYDVSSEIPLWIELHHNIDIDGVSARMNLNDIKEFLELEIRTNETYLPALDYRIDNYYIRFDSEYENLSNSRAFLSKAYTTCSQ